ncbi:DNA-protecting protein DprA [Sporolactobacillus shoreicorticis]|uniref:DNA-processing protein DprA n=1 Tax=Sporolactobacillus shoreicorticis TaxID=1923877 RepID=A0ABW5RYE6_9BACL|nr:DNA-processing protein DprA [Sporolactobacillus shoreicorticis]MCO7124766.1 DNA-protecting protein DprA [Sporolactobacillus shoreicorticis]
MNKKEILFVLYDLGLSLSSLSKLYRNTTEEQLTELLKGNFLELQFLQDIFTDKDINLLASQNLIEKSKITISETLDKLSKENIEYYIYYESLYPKALKNIPSPPFFIFMKGNKNLLENKFICSIVGTRNPALNTLKQIESVVNDLVTINIVIASGLAYGTDIQAHISTLNANGETIAVLPSPITNVTPKHHKKYASQIIENGGLLISEYYKIENVFKKTNYINRNRIISGLSNVVIITECSEKSGTMHTARFAFKQKRPIFCFDNNSTGINKILSSNSARIYTKPNDLFN